MRFERLAAGALALILGATLVGCPAGGGGFTGDGSMLGGGRTTTFTATNPTPGPLTVSMAPGATGTDTFQVRLLVTDVTRFFGAAFRVTYDPAVARFDGFDATGSFIAGAGATDFRAVPDPANPGVLLVNATLQGQLSGVDAVGSQLLLTLDFDAVATTPGSALGFGGATTRRVTTCPAPPAACTDLGDATLTWSGGTLVSN